MSRKIVLVGSDRNIELYQKIHKIKEHDILYKVTRSNLVELLKFETSQLQETDIILINIDNETYNIFRQLTYLAYRDYDFYTTPRLYEVVLHTPDFKTYIFGTPEDHKKYMDLFVDVEDRNPSHYKKINIKYDLKNIEALKNGEFIPSHNLRGLSFSEYDRFIVINGDQSIKNYYETGIRVSSFSYAKQIVDSNFPTVKTILIGG